MLERKAAGPAGERGFTLIELLIAIVVLALLLAIAVPTYQDQMRKTRRSEAQIALVEMANLEEKFFINASPPRYTRTVTGTPLVNGLGYATAATASGNYALDIPTGSGTAFSVRAQTVAGKAQASDTECKEFTINHLGVKAAKDASNADTTAKCWRK